MSRRPQPPPLVDDESLEVEKKISQLRDRIIHPTEDGVCSREVFRAICQRHSINVLANSATTNSPNDDDEPALIESLTDSPQAIPSDFATPLSTQTALSRMSHDDWRQLQIEDDNVRIVIECFQSGENPRGVQRAELPREAQLLLRHWDKLKLDDGVLYRKSITSNGRNISQLVVPKSHRHRALHGIHNEVGHLGMERTLDLARSRFFWPNMTTDVERNCQTCERCVRRKRAEKSAPMVSIRTTAPIQLFKP